MRRERELPGVGVWLELTIGLLALLLWKGGIVRKTESPAAIACRRTKSDHVCC